MTTQFSAPITDLLNLPSSLSGISTELNDIFARVGLSNISVAVDPPDFDPGDISSDPPLSDDEADAIQEWFEGELEELSPDVSIPQNVVSAVAVDSGRRIVTLQLQALSEIEVDLSSSAGISFVLNPGSFAADVTITPDGVSVAFGLMLVARFKPNLLQPMRKVAGNGQPQFEPDLTRPFTQVGLGEINVVVNSAGNVEFDSQLVIQLDDPVKLVSANLVIESARLLLDFRGDRKGLVFQWQESNLSAWLSQVAPNFKEQGNQSTTTITLRVVLGDPIEEVRLDWQASGNPRDYLLPGLKVTTPSDTQFSLLLRSRDGGDRLNQLTLILTQDANQSISASSNFAWSREGDRELQNDDNQPPDADPLIKVEFETLTRVSLVLLDMKLDTLELPTFFKQLETPLAALDFNTPDSLLQTQPFKFQSLQPDAWTIESDFNTEDFNFPFLRNESAGQRITINLGNPDVDIAETQIGLSVGAMVRIGDIELGTEFDITFNWETFAFDIDHDKGIHFLSGELPEQTYLGLTWRFQGKKVGDNTYHHFTLVTKDFNYQLIQPEGASIELDYTRASDEPITFIVSNFAITDKGINLSAEVSDRPARLNGVDTRFRFHGSRLDIVENQIKDFTLAGSGPLPPDLVGDAMVDIALQFSQQDGALTLVAGGATLKAEKLLSCQGTRFEFSVDAIGLKFVNDGKFHLYFTLTGTAQFNPLSTDDSNGPLALLKGIKIQMVECPLTGDISVIGKHVNFLIELPEAVSFSFLGCFTMELRSIGFVPQFERFGGDAAMELGGQMKFAQGTGDVNTVQIDFHNLFVGLPAKGSFVPRLYLQELEVNISLGEAFKLNGVVEFRDDADEKGFLGEGVLEIPGMPVFAASFAFLRVRRDDESPWVRAWFIYLEVRQISFYIPYVEFYIREVGLGFGYRYTIASIKAADEAGDLKTLIGELRTLSRTQGDLSKRDRWAVDLEGPGEDLRWTIVLRALISQTSATPGSISLKWLEQAEQVLPCLFLFDAVIAFRSDLTFFMAVRAWINSNYYDYVNDVNEIRERPLFSGFVLLSVRQKRFLAQISSNPEGSLGTRPPLPAFVEQAVRNGQFAATILVEPGLLHAELGWPNMLRWGQKLGPLEAEISGGMIFRVTKHYLVLGISFKARASLSFEAGLDLKVVGVRVSAHASVAYGARFIGLIDFTNPEENSALYAGIGLEIRIKVSIALWINLLFFKKTFRLSLEIGFTAGLELGIDGLTNPGLRGSGTLLIAAMGRRLQVSVKLGANESAVQTALNRTAPFLDLGLEATDVDRSIPGVSSAPDTPAAPLMASRTRPVAALGRRPPTVLASRSVIAARTTTLFRAIEEPSEAFRSPHYDIFVIRQADDDGWGYFVLLPRGEATDDDDGDDNTVEELGFLPAPPNPNVDVTSDFDFDIPADRPDDFVLEHFRPLSDVWEPFSSDAPNWRVDWDAVIEEATQFDEEGNTLSNLTIRLSKYLRYAFRTQVVVDDDNNPVLDEDRTPIELPVGDPDAIAPRDNVLEDERVQNPSEESYEAAVRGALEQFRSSPFFKRDPNSVYEQTLEVAFRDGTSIYTATGEAASGETGDIQDDELLNEEQENQQAHQLRGLIIQDLIADVRDYAAAPSDSAAGNNQPKPTAGVDRAIAFQMGLVFRFKGTLPDWLQVANPAEAPRLSQRLGPDKDQAGNTDEDFKTVRTFNVARADFAQNPPQFEQVQPLTDANTIAIAWNLTWATPPEGGCSPCQSEPEHHLLHYQVRRRALDGQEREVVYTLKSAEAAHFEATFEVTPDVLDVLRSQGDVPDEIITPLQALLGQSFESSQVFLAAIRNILTSVGVDEAQLTPYKSRILQAALQRDSGVLKRLRPRFQVVDHFSEETLEDQASLPATGRSYLYTITPIDFAGNSGRPLTLVTTRYPNEPPRVPVDGQFMVSYRLADGDVRLDSDPDHPIVPTVLVPERIQLRWSEPTGLREGPRVATARYRLIFRKDETLPIGSYGLDSSTQGPRAKSLPTSNARPLPTDIKIDVQASGLPQERRAEIALIERPNAEPEEIPLINALQRFGVLPSEAEERRWRPESWRVFIQTISVNGVPSALAPVQLILHFESFQSVGTGDIEERQPAQLEWVPHPITFPMLPPEDERAIAGVTHVPMPKLDDGHAPQFTGDLDAVHYDRHPANLRLVRFRWNQGPSDQPNYPISLNAGYTLLELDVDAHTTQTFGDRARLAEALRTIQEVQLLPADDLWLTPKDTLAANQWEAWYPSRLLRSRSLRSSTSNGSQVDGSQTDIGPWYSWRESFLEWPEWPGLTDPDSRTEALHPLLQTLLDTLDENPAGYLDVNRQPLRTYNVDVQYGPPRQPGDFATFRMTTAPKSDPYGWSILQQLGLSMGMTLRDETSHELVTGQDLLDALREALDAIRNDEGLRETFADLDILYQQLYVELLFQPSRSFEPASREDADADSLLAIAQLSLRPLVQPYLTYGSVLIQGPARTAVNLLLTLEPTESCSLIDQSNSAAGQQELQASDKPVRQTVRLPLNGQTRLLLRYKTRPAIAIELTSPLNFSSDDELPARFKDYFEYDASVPQLKVLQSLYELPNDQQSDFRTTFRSILAEPDRAIADITLALLTDFSPLDERSTYFTVPPTLADEFGKPSTSAGKQWRRLKLFLESINSNDPTQPRIQLPTSKADLESLLPDFLSWSQRFFDASDDVVARLDDEIDVEPWLVTAYPRISTPAYATPDASGRLKYDHLLEDRWAHNYRYYVRPYSRYELLWQSLLQSPRLFPRDNGAPAIARRFESVVVSERSIGLLENKVPADVLANLRSLRDTVFQGREHLAQSLQQILSGDRQTELTTLIVEAAESFSESLPDPQGGGLDITLERTQPVDKPLILRSARLDAPSAPSSPAPPGTTWEVIIAQHPEQSLSERNQTLVRRLAFRQVAFSLLRRFAYPDWIGQLEQASTPSHSLSPQWIENQFPQSPESYPDEPDHIDFSEDLDPAVARSLELPVRIGNFQQGALVLQWEALPFFYEHRLLVIAQTASTVSPVNETTQRDFEYQSPDPRAIAESIQADWNPVDPFTGSAINLRTRRVQIPLQRFWDALPDTAQAQWQSEAPDAKDADEPRRKLSSLPDPEAIYQIVELFSGNVEVQVEYFFDPEIKRFALRQLGKRFLGELLHLIPPPAGTAQADYVLDTTLQQITEIQLKRTGYAVPLPTRRKIAIQAPSVFVVSVLTQGDRHNLLLNSVSDLNTLSVHPGGDTSRAEAFLDEWYTTRPFASAPTQAPDLAPLPASLLAKLDYPELPNSAGIPVSLIRQFHIARDRVTWQGIMLPHQREALRTYRSNVPDHQQPVKDAIQRLVDSMQTEQISVVADYNVPSRPRPDDDFPGTYRIVVNYPSDTPENTNWVLRWTGPMSDSDAENLRPRQGDDAVYRNGVNDLIDQVQQQEFSQEISRPDPNAENFPTNFDFSSGKFSVETTATGRALRWTGSITPNEADTLRRLEGDQAFRDGVQTLIQEIQEFYDGRTFSETISFAWPRVNKARLASQIHNDLAGLEFPPLPADDSQPIRSGPIRWRGADNLGIPIEDLIRRVRAALRNDDPFLDAFRTLIRQLNQEFTASFDLKLLRCRQNLTQPERDALQALFPNAPNGFNDLFDDLGDRQVIDRLYDDWFSQEPISRALDELPDDLGASPIDFPEPTDCTLVWTGALSPDERTAVLNLAGDAGFQQALDQLTRIRPSHDALPDSLRNQLLIERDRLIWLAPGPTDEQRRDLRTLSGDEDFVNSVRRLINALQAVPQSEEAGDRTEVPLVPLTNLRSSPDTLPESLRSQLQIEPDRLIWTAPAPTDEQRQDLQNLDGDEEFLSAVQRLINALDAGEGTDRTEVPLLPLLLLRAFAPLGLDQVPPSLASQIDFSIDAGHYTQLRWTGALIDDDEQRLRRWAQIPAFQTAVEQLVETLDGQASMSHPLPDEIPAVLQNRFQINPNQLAWVGNAPDAEQRAALEGLQTDERRDQVLRDAIGRLLTAIDRNAGDRPVVAVSANDIPRRPTQADIPTAIRNQLSMTPTQVTWQGRVRSASQLEALQTLGGDAPVRAAIATLLTTLTQSVTEIPFADPIPLRPQPADLPDPLRAKLLIGRSVIRYHGLMTVQEGRDLQAAYDAIQPDRDAIQRLYDASINRGMQGRELRIRTRRGSAAPSSLNPLTPETL